MACQFSIAFAERHAELTGHFAKHFATKFEDNYKSKDLDFGSQDAFWNHFRNLPICKTQRERPHRGFDQPNVRDLQGTRGPWTLHFEAEELKQSSSDLCEQGEVTLMPNPGSV